MTKLCGGTLESIYQKSPKHIAKQIDWDDLGDKRPVGAKRLRLTCPTCKKRFKSSIKTCNDGCCLFHSLPPHKEPSTKPVQRKKWSRR